MALWERLLPAKEELCPITETCKECGVTIITGHFKRVSKINSSDDVEVWNEVVDHKMVIPGPCLQTDDGIHVINGL